MNYDGRKELVVSSNEDVLGWLNVFKIELIIKLDKLPRYNSLIELVVYGILGLEPDFIGQFEEIMSCSLF